MTKLAGSQLSLIAEMDVEDWRIGDWGWDEVGTDKISVPTSPLPKIGTEKIPVPTFTVDFRVTEKWQPPIGCLEQKWSKDRKYWYWRYYDNRGKKRSLYLAKDYNKAVRKVQKIGVPTDAKQIKPSVIQADPQTKIATSTNIIDIAPTAHGTSRSSQAA